MIIQVVHDVSAEKLFLKDLVAAGAVADLTGALWVSSAETDKNSTYTPLAVSLYEALHNCALLGESYTAWTDL